MIIENSSEISWLKEKNYQYVKLLDSNYLYLEVLYLL